MTNVVWRKARIAILDRIQAIEKLPVNRDLMSEIERICALVDDADEISAYPRIFSEAERPRFFENEAQQRMLYEQILDIAAPFAKRARSRSETDSPF